MAKFDHAWKFLHSQEGGYVNHSADPGGATNHGISLRWYRNNVNPDATKEDIRQLKEEQAADFALKYWWKNTMFYAIHSQEVANRVFSLAFNTGPRNATRILQRAINATEEARTTLRVDGILGPKTVDAVNSVFPKHLLKSLRDKSLEYYERLVEKRPNLRVFLEGWRNRVG